jgi:hypothetical protein
MPPGAKVADEKFDTWNRLGRVDAKLNSSNFYNPLLRKRYKRLGPLIPGRIRCPDDG